MPSDTTEPIFQECDLGGAVASVVADPLSGAGTKAQRCFGLTWLAPGPDRGHESAGVVVQLIPVVEFFERRSGEPCQIGRASCRERGEVWRGGVGMAGERGEKGDRAHD